MFEITREQRAELANLIAQYGGRPHMDGHKIESTEWLVYVPVLKDRTVERDIWNAQHVAVSTECFSFRTRREARAMQRTLFLDGFVAHVSGYGHAHV